MKSEPRSPIRRAENDVNSLYVLRKMHTRYTFSETYSRLQSFSVKRMRVLCCGRRTVSTTIFFETYTVMRRFSGKRIGELSSTKVIASAKTRAKNVFVLAFEFWTSQNLHDEMCDMHQCIPRCVCIHDHWMDSENPLSFRSFVDAPPRDIAMACIS